MKKERQLKGEPLVNLTEGSRATDKVAGFVGVSRNTLKKAEDIVNAAEKDPELYQYMN